MERVVYANNKNLGEKEIMYLNRGICFVEVSDTSLGSLYFVVGVAKVEEVKKDWSMGSPVTWAKDKGFMNEGDGVCSGLKGLAGTNLTLGVPFEYMGDFNARLDKNSVITVANDKGQTIIWTYGKSQEKRAGVVLGVLR